MSTPVSRTPESGTSSSGVAITWLGHATVLVEIDGRRVITDPVLRHRVGPLVRIAPDAPAPGPVDCVLLSHLHADHTDLPTLRALERSGPVLVPYPAREWLTERGLGDVRDLRPGDEIGVGGLRITATAAVHDPRRRPLGPAATPAGYVIRGSSAVYFAGDTDLFAGMAELRGAVDVALLPVWGWGARVGAGHLDPRSAAEAAALIAPAVAIPIHWGTFALARPARRAADPGRPAREFAAFTKQYAPAVEVRVLAPGERTAL
ncbi:MAG TPA: MBL fold metallo-hydrolase [Solirubrobacteraceae bacterium]|nr:MBL fold metallo-hydrolase [Solirubrobacteraceae bacterium]